jgi:hypothetical protein
MKKKSLLIGIISILTYYSANSQLPVTLTGSSFYTNDNGSPTTLQNLACHSCFYINGSAGYFVPAIQLLNTNVVLASYTFVPGFNYSVTVNATASASGNLTAPANSPVYYGVTVGTPASTNNNLALACQAFPNYPTLYNFTAQRGYTSPAICNFTRNDKVDLSSFFLTGVVGIGSLPDNGSPSASTTNVFTVPNPVNGLNIELYPVLGDMPPLLKNDASAGNNQKTEPNATGSWVFPSSSPYNMPTLSYMVITSVTVNKTAITYPYPTINGNTSFYFSAATLNGNGVINATPGTTVTVRVSAGGPPTGGTYSTAFYLSGASFNSNTSGSSYTTLTASGGSNTGTFIMPVNGAVNWSGNFSESNSSGSGGITVQ